MEIGQLEFMIYRSLDETVNFYHPIDTSPFKLHVQANHILSSSLE